MRYASVVQLDRASDSGSECWGFESLRACQKTMYEAISYIVFCFSILNSSRSGVAKGSPSREGTRSGPACPRHAVLRFGFGRAKKEAPA